MDDSVVPVCTDGERTYKTRKVLLEPQDQQNFPVRIENLDSAKRTLQSEAVMEKETNVKQQSFDYQSPIKQREINTKQSGTEKLFEANNADRQNTHNSLSSLKEELFELKSEFVKERNHNRDRTSTMIAENKKLQTKVGNLEEQLTNFRQENLKLKQQPESLQHPLNDRSGEAYEKFTKKIVLLKAENEKTCLNLEERHSSLLKQVSQLKDENRNLRNRMSKLEQEHQSLKGECSDMLKELSVAKVSLEVSSKAREQIESERHKLCTNMEKPQQKYKTSHQRLLEVQAEVNGLNDTGRKVEGKSDEAHIQLINLQHNQGEENNIRKDVEGTVHHSQNDIPRMDVDLIYQRHTDFQQSEISRIGEQEKCEVTTYTLITKDPERYKDISEKDVSFPEFDYLSLYERRQQKALTTLQEHRKKVKKKRGKLGAMNPESEIKLSSEIVSMKSYSTTSIPDFDKEQGNSKSDSLKTRQQTENLQFEERGKEDFYTRNGYSRTILFPKRPTENAEKPENRLPKLEDTQYMNPKLVPLREKLHKSAEEQKRKLG